MESIILHFPGEEAEGWPNMRPMRLGGSIRARHIKHARWSSVLLVLVTLYESKNLIGFLESILESPRIVIFNLTFRISKIEIFQISKFFLALEYLNLDIEFSIMKISNSLYSKS